MPAKIILIASDSNIGGATKHILCLVKRLPKKEFEPIILSPNGWLILQAKSLKLKTLVCNYQSIFSPKVIMEMRCLIDKENPRLLHAHGLRAGIVCYLATLFSGRNFIYSEHLYTKDYHLKSRLRELFQLLAIKIISSKAKKIIAPSSAVKEFLHKTLDIPNNKILVIYNGLESKIIENKPIKNFKIGFIGSLNSQKGLEYLIAAMFRLTCRFKKLKLEIVGDGELKEELQKKSFKLGDKIKFVGSKDNIWPYLASWELLVMPSLSESFGLVALEAAIAKRPVVATRVGGLSEVVLDKKTGILVEPKDSDALVKAISYILDHPDIAKKMGKTAYQRFEHKFTAKIMNDQMIKIYNEVLNI